MNGRTIAAVLLTIVIITGGVFLAIGAFNAGVTQGLVESGQLEPAARYIGGPYAGGWGYGGPGFGFFGFLATLFVVFLLFGLVRAAVGGGRGWGRGGYGRWSGWDPERHGRWEGRAREIHDEWHRSHPDGDPEPGATPRS